MWRVLACFGGAADGKVAVGRFCEETRTVDSVRPGSLQPEQGSPGFRETRAAAAPKHSPELRPAERGGRAAAGAIDVPHLCHTSANPDECNQGLMRDALVLSSSIASITIFTQAGRVLHQNDASRQLLGNLVRDGSLLTACSSPAPTDTGMWQRILLCGPGKVAPSKDLHQDGAGGPLRCGPEVVLAADGSRVTAGADADDTNVLASIFALEPDKLEEMLWEIRNNGGVWRGVVRVPCMLMVSTPTCLFPAYESETSERSGPVEGGPQAAGSGRERARRQGRVGGRSKDSGGVHAARPAAPSTVMRLDRSPAGFVTIQPAEQQEARSQRDHEDHHLDQQQRQLNSHMQGQQHHHHQAGDVERRLGVQPNGTLRAAPSGDTHTADTTPSQVDVVYENAVDVSFEPQQSGAANIPRTRSDQECNSCPRILCDGSGGASASASAFASAARHPSTQRSTLNTLTPLVHDSLSQNRRGSLNKEGPDSLTSRAAACPYSRYENLASANSLSTSVFALILGAHAPETTAGSAVREPSSTAIGGSAAASSVGARTIAAAVPAGRSETSIGFVPQRSTGPRARPKRSASLIAFGGAIRAAEDATAGAGVGPGGAVRVPQVPGRSSALAVSTSATSFTGRSGPAASGGAFGNQSRSRVLIFATSLRTAPEAGLLPNPTSSVTHSHFSSPPVPPGSPKLVSRGISFDIPSSPRTAGCWRLPISPPATCSGFMERRASWDRVQLRPAVSGISSAGALVSVAHRLPGPLKPPAPELQGAAAHAQTHTHLLAHLRAPWDSSAMQPRVPEPISIPEGDRNCEHSNSSASVLHVDRARSILLGTAALLPGRGEGAVAAPGAGGGTATAGTAAGLQDTTLRSCPSVASDTDFQFTLTGTTSRSLDVPLRPPHCWFCRAPGRSGGACGEPLQAAAFDGNCVGSLGSCYACRAPLAKCPEETSLVLSDVESCASQVPVEDPAARKSDPVAPPGISRSSPADELALFVAGTAAAAGAAPVPADDAAAATWVPAHGRSAGAAPSGEQPEGCLQQSQQLLPSALPPPQQQQQQAVTSACREVTARIAGMSNAPRDDSISGRIITAVAYDDTEDEDDDKDDGRGGGVADAVMLCGAQPLAPPVPVPQPQPPRLGSTAARVAEQRRKAEARALAAAAAQGAVARQREVELQSPLFPCHDSMPADETYHEVWATPSVDPVTKEPVIILSQHDVTAKVLAERHLALVMETEHRLLEQLFPRHILAYITEEWTCEAARLANAMAGPVNALLPPAWRPAVRDCNALATCHPEVTLLFADIKGFTPMCKEVEPQAVMGMLNDLFSRFDANIDKYGVCKVETIGDCYFVAGGLLHEDEDGMAAVQQGPDHQHADRVFEFAKAMLEAASQVLLPTTGEAVSLRIGLHTGPVVSGVVGTRMPRFCLFGDTVNTASRMESTGVPGAIHVSETTHALLQEKASWMATGGIEVKRKGLMQTYLWLPQ